VSGIDPWRFVDADDDLVADFLAGTIEVVHELGAWLHPALRIIARKGHLRMEADAPDGERLIHLPAAASIPISRVTWDDAATLAFHDDRDELSAPAAELLMLQVALHNACNKLPTLIATHPAMASDLSDDVITAVRALKPRFRAEERSAVSLFWSNRVLRIPARVGAEPEPMALPIVDLLDHRRGGATGTWTGDAFTVDIAHAGAGAACFLDYGHDRDALDFAIDYGFVDDAKPDRTVQQREDIAALELLLELAEMSTSHAAGVLAEVARQQLGEAASR
jgi:hypothetical protein